MTDKAKAPLASFCYCIAVILLGVTLERSEMRFDAVALACAAIAVVVVALPLCLPPIYFSRGALTALMAVGIAIGFYRLPYLNLFILYPQSRPLLRPFIVMAAIAAVLTILILLGRPRALVGGVFVLLLLDVGLMGLMHLDLSTSPACDVYVFQEQSCDALVHGKNPFAITFPDIYWPNVSFYPPGMVVDRRVQSGYDYPPLTLLLDLPGYFFGDLRYVQLCALLIATAMIGYGRRDFAPAALLLFTPKIFYVIENAWLETYSLVMLAAVVWCACKQKLGPTAIAVGLLLVTKQYLLLTVPVALLLLPTPWRLRETIRFGLLALAAGSIVTLPFILWNPAAFFHSMTALFRNVLRQDSISFLPIISRMLGTRLTLLCPLLAAIPPSVLILLRSPRSPASFAAGVALVCLCVFAFSTQAFTNYYFFAAAALCAAIASTAGDTREPIRAGFDVISKDRAQY